MVQTQMAKAKKVPIVYTGNHVPINPINIESISGIREYDGGRGYYIIITYIDNYWEKVERGSMVAIEEVYNELTGQWNKHKEKKAHDENTL